MGAISYRKIEKTIRGDERFQIREAAGSHVVVKGPDNSSMTIYHQHGGKDAYPPGIACKIRKWFMRFGVVLVFYVLAFCVVKAFFV